MATVQTVPELLDVLEAQLVEDERVLRNQADGKLSDRAEGALAAFASIEDRFTRTMRRYVYVRHLFIAAHEGLSEGGDDETAALASLMHRDPVPVDLGTRTVSVTGRSWAAYRFIAQHSTRIAELQTVLGEAARLTGEVAARLAAARTRGERSLHRRHLRRLGEVTRRLMYETALHRQALYAHIFTPDGRPAESLDDAPAWWVEITPAADVLVMRAMWEAGPGRYHRAQDPHAAVSGGGGERGEKYGFHSTFAHISRGEKCPPAEPYARDFYQLLAFVQSLAEAMRGREEAAALEDMADE